MLKNIFHLQILFNSSNFVYIIMSEFYKFCWERERWKEKRKTKKKQWMAQHKIYISKDHSTQKHRVKKKEQKSTNVKTNIHSFSANKLQP